jgi:hypothetical protein
MWWNGTNEVPVAPKFGNRASPVNVQTRAHLAIPKEGRGTDTETQPWHIPVYQRLLSFYHNIVFREKNCQNTSQNCDRCNCAPTDFLTQRECP